jgi:hypothetical protein
VKTDPKYGADAQLSEKHLCPETATTSFQMRHSQGMTFSIALSTSPSSPSCVSALCIGLVPHWDDLDFAEMLYGCLGHFQVASCGMQRAVV